jgi:hypothetical protein
MGERAKRRRACFKPAMKTGTRRQSDLDSARKARSIQSYRLRRGRDIDLPAYRPFADSPCRPLALLAPRF